MMNQKRNSARVEVTHKRKAPRKKDTTAARFAALCGPVTVRKIEPKEES